MTPEDGPLPWYLELFGALVYGALRLRYRASRRFYDYLDRHVP